MSQYRVAMIGAFNPDYPRNHSLRLGLERNGVAVMLAAAPVKARTGARILHVWRQRSLLKQCDVILIPTFNQLLAPFIWALGKLFNKPVLLDYMVGLTDLMEDRGAVSPFKAAMYRWVDRFNLSRMTSITDTRMHCETFRALLGRDFPKLRVVPVGVRNNPPVLPLPPSSDRLLVQYVGTY
ncbi:MAG: glycosyltransferase, partial [Anaerolineae bacterium]|nr:glycosyltransferase [Anaerolineae bacterium]